MIDLQPVYGPSGAERPGEFPFTRGIRALPEPWIMGQYGGFGTPADTNARFRELIANGQTGLSVALDLPTQLGLDSSHPRALGEVGRVGVAIDDLDDVETLMRGLPLDRLQVRTTANSIGYVWTALIEAYAVRSGSDPRGFGIFIQNDPLKEYIARGTQIFPAPAAVRLAVDVMEHTACHLPNWVPIALSGYHIREAGADAAMEVGYAFSNAIEYLDQLRARGVSVEATASTLFTFLSANMDFLQEIAKFRAARRVWAKLMHDRYGLRSDAARQLRIFVFTAGSSLTAQQPLNNVVRTAVEAVAAVLGGVQTMHVCAYDEALGVPTLEAATLALRTQQIIAAETGLATTLDPLAGSYAIETLTDQLEDEITRTLAAVEARGGSLACIEDGWFRQQIGDAAYATARAVEDGDRTIIGVNRFVSDPAPLEVFEIDESAEADKVAALEARMAARDQRTLQASLDRIRRAVEGPNNVVPECRAAALAGATVGEMIDALRTVFGSWTPVGAF